VTVSAVIVGAGAIGAWLGDALDRAGWRVSMVARGATLTALRNDGLRVTHRGVTRVSHPHAGSPGELGAHDFVFLTLKAQLLPEIAPTLSPLIGPTSLLISATNGIPWWFFHDFGGPLANRSLASVDPYRSQEQTFPRQQILGAVVHASARALSPANVEVIAADRLILGEPNGDISSRLEAVVKAFRDGGINALASPRIRHDVWSKLWGNMNMNPLSALARSGTAKLLADTDVRMLCIHMMREMEACAALLGLRSDITPVERMAITQRLGDFKTSMLADLEAGRALELAPQLGAVVEIAELLDVPAPFSRSILGLARLLAP